MNIEKVTPVLVVDAIEPLLDLWTNKLGFEKTVEVPHGEGIGFAIFVRGDTEVMLQTLASCRDDDEGMAKDLKVGDVLLYAHVDSLEAAKTATAGLERIVEERTTFYGAKEIFVRTVDGHRMGLAEMK